MQLSKFRTDLRQMLGESSNSSNWSDTLLDRWINRAYKSIASLFPWQKLQIAKIQTTTSSQYYDLPSDYLYGGMFRLQVDGTDYKYVESNVFFTEDYDTDETFTIFNNWFFLEPTPSESGLTMTMYYHERPADMSADTDTPDLPSELDEAILQYALGSAYMKDKQVELAQKSENDAIRVTRKVWSRTRKNYRGPQTVNSYLRNFPNYSCSGNV